MATGHKLATSTSRSRWLSASRAGSAGLAHLRCMDTTHTDQTSTPSPVLLTLSQLADYLGVCPQTLYDLRSQGRGPRGFRVGRELRFRLGEVEDWLARMEAADAERHPSRGARS